MARARGVGRTAASTVGVGVLALLLTGPVAVSAGSDIVWARQFGTTDYEDVTGADVDSTGAVIVVGTTRGRFAGQRWLGQSDAFVRKYSAAGAHRWTRQFGTPAHDGVFDVAVGRGDAIYVVGSDDGGATLRRFSRAGRLAWTRRYAGPDGADGWAVAVTSEGIVVIAGTSSGRDGDSDAFVRAYSQRGTVLWTRRFGSPAEDFATDIAAGPAGELYVVGATHGSAWGSAAGDEDVFLRRLDRRGRPIWTRQFGTSEEDRAQGVTVDPSGGIYISGGTRGTIEGAPVDGQEGDAFVRAYDADGSVRWTRVLSVSFYADARAIRWGPSGLQVVGGIYGTAPGFPGDDDDAFLRTYDPDGDVIGTVRISTNQTDTAVGVAPGAGGRVFVAGWTGGVMPGQRRVGKWDGFLVSIAP